MIDRRRLYCFAAAMALLALVIGPVAVQAAPPGPQVQGEDAPVTMAPPIPRRQTTVTSRPGLRLREGPSLGDRIILVLRYGEVVYPAAGPVWSNGMSWAFVIVYRWGYRYEGFCASSYLADQGGAPPPPQPPHGQRVRVTAPGGLRLRTGPATWYRIRRVVSYGTILHATGRNQWGSGIEWSEVILYGEHLWAASRYLVPS